MKRARRTRAAYPPNFLLAAFTTLLIVSGINILVPALPGYARSFDISAAEVGLVVGAFALGRLLFDIAGGAMADRYGVRLVAALGCLITAVAAVAGGLADTYEVLLASRLVQGIGSALYVSTITALIVSLVPAERAGRLMATYQGIFLLGLALGPLIGGLVADAFGLAAPMHAYAMLSLMAMVLVLWRIPGRIDRADNTGWSPPDDARIPYRVAGVGQVLRHPAFLVSLLVLLVMFIVRAGLRNTAVPLFAAEDLGLSPSLIGAVLTFAALGQLCVMWHAGYSIDRYGRRPVLVGGLLVTAGAAALFALAVGPLTLIGCVFFLGAAMAYSSTAPTVLLVDLIEPRLRGFASGVQRTAMDLGQLLGPVLLGFLVDVATYQSAFILTGVSVLVVAGLAGFMPETRPRTPIEPD